MLSTVLIVLLLSLILIFFFLLATVIGVFITQQSSRRNFLLSVAFFAIQLFLLFCRNFLQGDAPPGVLPNVSFMWLGVAALAVGSGLLAGSRLRKPGT